MIDFKGHRFEKEIILICVRWYLAYPLSYRNLEEMMAERGVQVDGIDRNFVAPGKAWKERKRAKG
jgi:transposase-like protein